MGYIWTVEFYNGNEYIISWEGNNFQEALENMKIINREGYKCIRLTYRGEDFEKDIKLEEKKWEQRK